MNIVTGPHGPLGELRSPVVKWPRMELGGRFGVTRALILAANAVAQVLMAMASRRSWVSGGEWGR